MSHRRSLQKYKERTSRRKIHYSLKTVILKEAWNDHYGAETVSRTAHQSLIELGYSLFKENFSTTFVPDIDCGFVLTDSRGRGAFQ